MEDKIIDMLNDGKDFVDIFLKLKCTDEEFIQAISKQQEMELTTATHDNQNYDGVTVEF